MATPKFSPGVSVIIPVLNDAPALKRCLEAMRGWDCERIVVDGGSQDNPAAVAKEFGAMFVTSPAGRGTQMNIGSGKATRQWLWFLHADCVPPPEALASITALTKYQRWGCFKHRIDAPGFGFRAVEWADNFRAKWMGTPYGDQGIFADQKAFEDAGGYPEVPILEDVKLSQALSKFGAPIIVPHKLSTDARRWQKYGVWKVMFRNWKIMWLYLMKNKTPQELAGLYQL